MWMKEIIIRKERSRSTKGGCRVTRDIPECNEAIACCFLPEYCVMRTIACFLTDAMRSCN